MAVEAVPYAQWIEHLAEVDIVITSAGASEPILTARKFAPIPARRRNRPLLLIDIDKFKPYNDQFGHSRGDECLRQVAQALNRCTKRPGDVAARYGGEEFAIILPETDEAGAAAVAETARREIAALKLEHPQSKIGIVTISVGCASIIPSIEVDKSDLLVQQADIALYRAKACGRNQALAFAGLARNRRRSA